MPQRSVHTTVLLAAATLLIGVLPAAAQRATGPYSGLLGGSDDTQARQTLDVRASLSGAWDDILTSTDESALNDQFLRSGFAGGASGVLIHARRSQRLQWNSSAATSVRMYGKGSDAIASTFSTPSAVSI